MTYKDKRQMEESVHQDGGSAAESTVGTMSDDEPNPVASPELPADTPASLTTTAADESRRVQSRGVGESSSAVTATNVPQNAFEVLKVRVHYSYNILKIKFINSF